MRKVAIIASAMALAATQMSTAVLAAESGETAEHKGKPWSQPKTIAVSLGALTAVVLGVVAVTDDNKKPASP